MSDDVCARLCSTLTWAHDGMSYPCKDTLKVIPMEALVANLGAVLEIVHRQLEEAKQTEDDEL